MNDYNFIRGFDAPLMPFTDKERSILYKAIKANMYNKKYYISNGMPLPQREGLDTMEKLSNFVREGIREEHIIGLFRGWKTRNLVVVMCMPYKNEYLVFGSFPPFEMGFDFIISNKRVAEVDNHDINIDEEEYKVLLNEWLNAFNSLNLGYKVRLLRRNAYITYVEYYENPDNPNGDKSFDKDFIDCRPKCISKKCLDYTYQSIDNHIIRFDLLKHDSKFRKSRTIESLCK